MGEKNELETYICGFVTKILLCVYVWTAFAIRVGLKFYCLTFMCYHLSSKVKMSELSPLTSIKGRRVFPCTVLLCIRTCLQ